MPSCSAVIFWRLPNRTLDDVSLPVSATPSQPSSGEKNGNSTPVLANARPMRRVDAARSAWCSRAPASRRSSAARARTRRSVAGEEPQQRRTGDSPAAGRRGSPASSSAVPVADSQLKLKTAFSGFGFGDDRRHAQHRVGAAPAPAICATAAVRSQRRPSPAAAPDEDDQRQEHHGIQRPPRLAGPADRRCSRAGSSGPASARLARASNRQVVRGCQTAAGATSATIDTSAPAMSTSQGPWKLLTRNCTSRSEPRGQARRPDLQHPAPARHRPRPARTGRSPRRTAAAARPSRSARAGQAGDLASVMIGVPSAPNATGAVLPISASPAAGSGLKPRPISMAAEIATGVPNPAAPSMKAPKLKAISSTWMRRSSARPAIVCLHDFELPGVDGDVVDEDRAQHDPADRAAARTPRRRPRTCARQLARHAVDEDRDRQRRGQADQRRQVRPHVEEREQPEQHDDRDRGDERREEQAAADGGVDLGPGHLICGCPRPGALR